MGPSSVSIAEDSDDSDAFSFVDGYLINLPAGMFDPKPTLGGYVVVLGFPSSNCRGCGCSHWSCGKACRGQDSRFPDCTEQDQRDGQDMGIGWRHGVQDASIDCFGSPMPDAHPQIYVRVNHQVCQRSFGCQGVVLQTSRPDYSTCRDWKG